ncbi:hypothetical protein [uncultured Sphingomonas sp.]|uniref:hypothetical protein n=1 Tax=uncultured Sphingomonas sp. TaxID=158754 RepID=UPI0035C9D757
MNKRTRWIAIALTAGPLSACAGTSKGGATDFTVRTTPAGATVETTRGYRCTSPCRVPLGPYAFAATVSLLGYKPVQIPVAAGENPGSIDINLLPQDPGAAAPVPVGGKSPPQ